MDGKDSYRELSERERESLIELLADYRNYFQYKLFRLSLDAEEQGKDGYLRRINEAIGSVGFIDENRLAFKTAIEKICKDCGIQVVLVAESI